MDQETKPQTNEQIFDGTTISPQFALALKNFVLNNITLKSASGASTVSGSTNNNAIPHGLGKLPLMAMVSPYFYPTGGGGVYIHQVAPFWDATNIYVDNDNSVAQTFVWAVIG